MRLLYCLLAILCTNLCQAAPPVKVKPLQIGDKVPDIHFSTVINSKKTTANLYSFKSKLLLVDFWATHCTSCIHKFPMLDSMQEKYPQELKVLLISNSPLDTKEKVTKLFERLRILNNIGLNLPVILKDTMARLLFPHTAIPHYAWLDSNFKVIAITDGDEVSAKHITDIIEGRPVRFLTREDQKNFTGYKPLFINGNGGSGSQLLQRASIASYIPGLPAATYVTRDTSKLVYQILLTNQPVLEMIKTAYQYFEYPPRINWSKETKEALEWQGKDGNWSIQNSYTYELITSPLPYDSALLQMQNDLKRYTGYWADRKILPTKCYILTADTVVLKKYISKGSTPLNQLFFGDALTLQNRPASDIVEFLNHILPIPVIDEVFFSNPIDIDLHSLQANLGNIKATLAPYGIYLTETTRPLENFFIYHLPN